MGFNDTPTRMCYIVSARKKRVGFPDLCPIYILIDKDIHRRIMFYLYVPSKRTKLLSFLDDSMEEADAKDEFPPLHAKN